MNLKTIGGYLFFFGLGSIVLNLLGREFVVLMWIDNWGETVGWIIRGGGAALGAILWLVGNAKANKPVADQA